MSEQASELAAFSKFIEALDPWLGEVVVIGGWAHRLYRLDSRARALGYVPLTTLDGDVAVPPKVKKEKSSVRKRSLDSSRKSSWATIRIFSERQHPKTFSR